MKKRSIFWPLVLIATGLVWLLVNLQVVPASNLWALSNLFPYILLALGIGLVVRSRWTLAGSILTWLVVLAVTLAVLFAAPLGVDKAPSWGFENVDFPFHVNGYSVNVGGAVKGSGVIASEAREVEEFTGVSVDFPAEVVIRQGEAQSVTLEADDNLLPQLRTRVTNGVLHIGVKNLPYFERVNPSRAVRVTITVKELGKLNFSTAGSVTIEGMQSDSLRVSVSGAGEVKMTGLDVAFLGIDISGAGTATASGSADSLRLGISGMGSLQADELQVDTAEVEISGAGSALLWVKDLLTASISGAGSVDYYGSPDVDKSISGVGSVNKLGDK